MYDPIAICGLNCEECDMYRVDFDKQAAQKILDWFQQEGYGFNEPFTGKWKYEPGVDDPNRITLEEFMAIGKKCYGCRGPRDKHWNAGCEYLLCCADEHKLHSCHLCPEFD